MLENSHSFLICIEIYEAKRTKDAQTNFVKFRLMQQRLFSFGMR